MLFFVRVNERVAVIESTFAAIIFQPPLLKDNRKLTNLRQLLEPAR